MSMPIFSDFFFFFFFCFYLFLLLFFSFFFFFFFRKYVLIFHVNCQSPFSGENEKNIASLSPAEFGPRVENVLSL